MVSDLGLPTLAGDDLYRSLVRLKPGLPVVLTSGFFDPEVKARLRSEGLTEFLQKPCTPADLLRSVRRRLDRPG